MTKKLRILLIVSASLLVIIISYMSILEILSVNKAIAEFNERFNAELGKQEFNFIPSNDSAIMAKQYQLAYYNSQLETAKSDSISLTLDLTDSTATLMIKGIVLHQAKIEKIKSSNFLQAVDPSALYCMLYSPIKVVEHKSTIQKVPLMVKIAPKDTSEYTPDVVPDTTDIDAVNYILETNAGIQLYFYESNPKESSNGLKQFKFDFRDRVQTGYHLFMSAVTFKKPKYQPEIRIKLKKRDAKIIYRALPEKADIILKIR
ncbi:MAG: hypothetical protein AB7S48_04460 [Bacteroidales bacterium]